MTEIDVPFVGGPLDGQTLTVPVDDNDRPIETVDWPTTPYPGWIGTAVYDLGQWQSANGPTWVYRYREATC